MKALLPMIVVLAGAYLVVVLLAFVFQDRLLFYPSGVSDSVRERPRHMAVAFDRDGTLLQGWLQRRPDAAGLPLLVYYDGNGDEVSWNLPPSVPGPAKVPGFRTLESWPVSPGPSCQRCREALVELAESGPPVEELRAPVTSLLRPTPHRSPCESMT